MNRNEYNLLKKAILSDPYYEKRGKPKKETWSARYKDVVDGAITYRRFSGGFKTKKACKEAFDYFCEERLNKLERDFAAEQAPEQMLFRDLTDRYYAYKRNQVKESTFNTDRNKIENRIIPTFGGKEVGQITPAMVLDWQISLENYSFEYRQKLMIFLKAILSFGEMFYNCPNISSKIPPLRSKELKKEMQFWTPDEFVQFLGAVDSEVYNLFFRLLFIAGCRKGEAMALLWSDVDFDACEISITKSITNKEGKAFAVTSPKNQSSVRVVKMPEDFIDELKSFKERKKMRDADYVFGDDRPLPLTTIDRTFKRAIDASGVKSIRIHDLRHSCASLLISKGFTIVAVSKRLGHSSTKETLDTYAHLFPTEAEALATAFVGITTPFDEKVGEKMGEIL